MESSILVTVMRARCHQDARGHTVDGSGKTRTQLDASFTIRFTKEEVRYLLFASCLICPQAGSKPEPPCGYLHRDLVSPAVDGGPNDNINVCNVKREHCGVHSRHDAGRVCVVNAVYTRRTGGRCV